MSKITESARGEDCTVRLPGCCNFNNETTVLAHLNGAGLAIKHPDYKAAYTCSGCHDVLDGRVKTMYSEQYIALSHYQGVMETQDKLFEKGLLIYG